MSFLLILLPVAAVVPIAYFAFSKKSSPSLRRVALIALILILLASAVSVFLILSGPRLMVAPRGDRPGELPAATARTDTKGLLIFGAILLLSIGVMIYFAIRESIKTRKKDK